MARSPQVPAPSLHRLAQLLAPYLDGVETPAGLYASLSSYLELLLRWNARTNLTAIREPEAIVHRHFGESLFAGVRLAQLVEPDATLLDFGSGAGFPGLPIQLLLPNLRVTLAESQGKKAAFLREAVRTLGLSTEVWPNRVESMPPDRHFDAAALRAVDDMALAIASARTRVAPGGWLVLLDSAPRPTSASHQLPGSLHNQITFEQL
jgi:16S rRNA (guanine527-N7)-methyltransferase